MRPRLMLFDEATSALDPEMVGDVDPAHGQLPCGQHPGQALDRAVRMCEQARP